MKFRKLIFILFVILTGCSSVKTTLPMGTLQETSVHPTAIVAVPTDFLIPTSTTTPEPSPLSFSGKGDTTMDVSSWPHASGVLSYEGQSTKGYFAIVPYDENNKPMSSICSVNSFDPYKGACVFNPDGEYAAQIEIKTVGKWVITISPLSQARTLLVPGTITGVGNDVIVLTGGIPDHATITGNPNRQLFTLIPYKLDGNRMISLVNTTDPYQGDVGIHDGTAIIEVMATGNWSIALTAK